MLVTATVSRKRANEALLKGIKINEEENDVIEEFDTAKIGEIEEINFIGRMIDSKSAQGKIELDLDFVISDKATEILMSFLYFVRREGKTIIGW